MLRFELLQHFLIRIICGRFEIRTVLDAFGDAFCSSLGCVFVGSLVADRTHLLTVLINDSSSRVVTSPRMNLVTRRALIWLVTFRRQSSIDRLVSEHLLGCLSHLLQIVEEVSPSSEFQLAPYPRNIFWEVLGHKSNIFFIILQER